MVHLELNTKLKSDKQTIGCMDVFKDGIFQISLATLEQEWNNNEISNSCLPPGFHIVDHYNSKNHPNTFKLRDTDPRSYILIHVLNYFTQTEGCIGVGLYHEYINSDKYLDLAKSREAMNKLRDICKDEKIISININR